MDIPNQRLSYALAVSILLHLVLLMIKLDQPAQSGAPGMGALSVYLSTNPIPAQSPETRQEIEFLPDIRVIWSANAEKKEATQAVLPGGAGGNLSVKGGRVDFNDSPSYIGQYPEFPLPSNDLSIPYLPPVLPWEISPHYPDAAFTAKIKGYVRLEILIDEIGKVLSVRVAESQPPGVFDDTAWKAFHKARFQPAYEYGWPVPSKISVKVIFDPEDQRKPRPQPTALK